MFSTAELRFNSRIDFFLLFFVCFECFVVNAFSYCCLFFRMFLTHLKSSSTLGRFHKNLRQMVFPNRRQSFKSLGNASRIHLKMVQRHQGKRKSIRHLKISSRNSKKNHQPSPKSGLNLIFYFK
jgi:hypothetical protein